MNPAPKTGATQTMKNELMDLIDALNLEDLPKRFLKSRWLDQLMWMEGKSRKNQRSCYYFRLACIVGGVVISVLVTVDAGEQLKALIHLMAILLSLVVALSAAIEEFFHFGERWRHYRQSAEFLKREGWSFFQLSGNYREHANHADAYSEFASRIEEAFQREVEVFITKLSKEKGDKQPKQPTGG